jgi:hypothetical protein
MMVPGVLIGFCVTHLIPERKSSSGQRWVLARDCLSANDPEGTFLIFVNELRDEVTDCLFGPNPLTLKQAIREWPMRRTIVLSVCASILGPQIVSAAEGEIPKFDIAAACRGSGSVQTPAKCMQDEQAALDQVTKQWREFKQADASRCIQITTSRAAAANYTELLSCLQAATAPQRTDPFGELPKISK